MALAAVLLFLGCSIIVAHSAAGEGHMSDGMVMCMAVMTIAATALGFARSSSAGLRVAVPMARLLAPALEMPVSRPAPTSRAGPALLQVFLR